MTFIHDPLLQPLRLGSLTIKNRFCAGPLTLPSLQGPFGEFSPDGLAYFEARAKGGFGLLYTGAFHPDVLVDPVHPLDSKQPLSPKTFQRTAVELLNGWMPTALKCSPGVHGLWPQRPGVLLSLPDPLLPRPRPAGPRPDKGPDPPEDRPDDRHGGPAQAVRLPRHRGPRHALGLSLLTSLP